MTDDYFSTMAKMQEAISKRDYERAAQMARENMHQVPAFVRCTKQSYGSFDISSIPAFEVGGTMLALMGDDEGLAEMRGIVISDYDLEPWINVIEQHEEDRRLFENILEVVQQNPGCRQTDMKSLVGTEDGRRVSNLIGWLEKAGKIMREKQGKTYAIWPAGVAQASVPPPKRNVRSHRMDRNPPPMREIDVARIPYVPLPRSPLRWEEAQVRGSAAELPEAIDYFEVRDANGWEIGTIETIPLEEKPDTAFRQLHPLDSGLLMVDDLGKAEGMGWIPAAVLRYGRSGELIAKKPLLHDIYRIDVNPMGRGLIAMSKDCIVHAYDDALEPILETTLMDAPEIRAIRKRFNISEDQLKNHIRCVALSRDGSRYLFTAVDEAWCIRMDGRGLWGVKLPIKDGWTQVSEPSEMFGTSGEIQQALSLMGMSYPFTPEDIKKRYRQLAKEWHPDLNPGDPVATERMQALTSAVQLLTGIGASALPVYTGVQYAQEISRSEVEVSGVKLTITASYVVSEIHAADWIYAASFAGWSNAVFLAGYSGRVVVLTDSGEPVHAYDIGSVPRRIADTGDYLYLLTDTRLYVLRDETLYTIIDTFDGGDLIVAQTGFGLLEKKRFRWFREDGTYLGGIMTKDPIRRVYSAPGGMRVETRTRRVLVRGVPGWWE
ncbi:MAG TPA: J domain-containing protein [Thermodesulfobacteriota bacterium]|nr:J domain-containing protein [Thermodesulfobacteriota bacterium]